MCTMRRIVFFGGFWRRLGTGRRPDVLFESLPACSILLCMTTFTTEELHTDTERVLATTVREGYTVVAGVDGYRIEIRAIAKPAPEVAKSPEELPFFLARMRRLGMPRVPREISDAVDRAIA